MTEDQLHDIRCYICDSSKGLSLLQSGLFKCNMCKDRDRNTKNKRAVRSVVKSTPEWQQLARQSQERILARRG